MKKGKAAQQLKALELRPITHQGITDRREVIPMSCNPKLA
jgi:hypothetical protein